MNPFCEGTRITLRLDILSKGYNRSELSQAFYGLMAEPRQGKLLLECASFDEIDQEYNPGDDDQNSDRIGTEELILEAVTVRAFSRTAQTMAALQRVLNKVMADKGLTVGDAVIGNPKKTGLFASVTVQFPISDGQTLSIIFHSPDNNKMQIMPDDVIIAFRWLLNKRDITVAVSPEGEKDVSLDEVGKRVSQLVEKNSQRFQTQQKALVEGKKALEDLKANVTIKQDENSTLMNALADKQGADKVLTGKIEGAKTLLSQTVNYNDQLQAQIDSLAAQQAANAGKAKGEGEKTPDQIQAEQDQAAFEDKKAAFESELTGRGFVSSPEYNGLTFESNGKKMMTQFNAAEPGGYEVRVSTDEKAEDGTGLVKQFSSATLAGLDKQIADALKWIDGKLGEMKKKEGDAMAREQFIAAANSDEVVTMSEDEYTAAVKKYKLGESIPGPVESIYAWAVRNRLEKSGITDPQALMQKFLDLYGVATNDAQSYVRIGLGYSVEGLPQYKDSPDLQAIRNNVTNKYDTVKDIIANIAANQLGGPQPVVTVNLEDNQESPAVQALNDILSGRFASSQEISDALDQAAGELEAAGLMEAQDSLLNSVADYLTEVLKKEAGGM